MTEPKNHDPFDWDCWDLSICIDPKTGEVTEWVGNEKYRVNGVVEESYIRKNKQEGK